MTITEANETENYEDKKEKGINEKYHCQSAVESPETAKTPSNKKDSNGVRQPDELTVETEVTPVTQDVTKSEVTPGTQDVTKSEATPQTQDVTKSIVTPGTHNVTKSEVTPGTQDVTKSEATPQTQDVTKSEVTPGTQDQTKTSTNEEANKSDNTGDKEIGELPELLEPVSKLVLVNEQVLTTEIIHENHTTQNSKSNENEQKTEENVAEQALPNKSNSPTNACDDVSGTADSSLDVDNIRYKTQGKC